VLDPYEPAETVVLAIEIVPELVIGLPGEADKPVPVAIDVTVPLVGVCQFAAVPLVAVSTCPDDGAVDDITTFAPDVPISVARAELLVAVSVLFVRVSLVARPTTVSLVFGYVSVTAPEGAG
jgi:hypothetical protein